MPMETQALLAIIELPTSRFRTPEPPSHMLHTSMHLETISIGERFLTFVTGILPFFEMNQV